jgi:hypothetical protein
MGQQIRCALGERRWFHAISHYNTHECAIMTVAYTMILIQRFTQALKAIRMFTKEKRQKSVLCVEV